MKPTLYRGVQESRQCGGEILLQSLDTMLKTGGDEEGKIHTRIFDATPDSIMRISVLIRYWNTMKKWRVKQWEGLETIITQLR